MNFLLGGKECYFNAQAVISTDDFPRAWDRLQGTSQDPGDNTEEASEPLTGSQGFIRLRES